MYIYITKPEANAEITVCIWFSHTHVYQGHVYKTCYSLKYEHFVEIDTSVKENHPFDHTRNFSKNGS